MTKSELENSKTQAVTKLNISNNDNFNCDKAQKIKFWQNLETQIATKLKNSNNDKTQKNLIVTTQLLTKCKNSLLVRTT